MEQYKACKRCGETKALDEFYRHSEGKLGRRPECKVCTGEAQMPYREANRAKARQKTRESVKGREGELRAYQRHRYATDPAYREKRLAASRARYQIEKHKHLAHRAVAAALRSGALVSEPCLFCGDPQVEGHHHSYAEADRLNVTWLCKTHHGLVHRIVDEAA